jgi:hypothetical protein
MVLGERVKLVPVHLGHRDDLLMMGGMGFPEFPGQGVGWIGQIRRPSTSLWIKRTLAEHLTGLARWRKTKGDMIRGEGRISVGGRK